MTGLLGRNAGANDSAFAGVPGSPEERPLRGEHPSIRMVSEKVVLTTGKTSFDTGADFVFRNESPRRVTVTMGFPETNYGDGWEDGPHTRSGFLRFASWVDGTRTRVKRTPNKTNEDYDAYWLKTVTFAPHQTRRVRVEATSPYGGTVEWGFNKCLSYNFTGGNWKGSVAQSDLEVRITQPGVWNLVGENTVSEGQKRDFWKPTVQMQGKTAVIKRSWRNWQAQSTVYLGLTRTLPSWMVDPGSSVGVVTSEAMRHAATVRAGNVTGAPGQINASAAPVFLYKNVPLISLWYAKTRLGLINDALPKARQTTIGQLWDQGAQEARITAGNATLGFQAGRASMTLVRGGAKTSAIALPVAPLVVKDEQGENLLYVPLYPLAKALGLSVKTDMARHTFTLTRGTWPTIPSS